MTQVNSPALTVLTELFRGEEPSSKPRSADHLAGSSFTTIGQTFKHMHRMEFRQDLKAVPLESSTHPLTPIALGILFPGTAICDLIAMQNMPDQTLEDKIEKENIYRNLILSSFELKEIVADKSSAFRAVISSINCDIDPKSEEITAMILRGDLVDHVIKHPEKFVTFFRKRGVDPEQWISQVASPEYYLGDFELEILCDLLEVTIHLYSYQTPCIGRKGKITSSDNGKLGSCSTGRTLCLYYDPVRSHYRPMFAR